MKRILLIITLMLTFSVANALPVIPFVVSAFVASAGSDTSVRPCDSEPKRLVSEIGKNYNVEVNGCEYQAHKDSMSVLEIL